MADDVTAAVTARLRALQARAASAAPRAAVQAMALTGVAATQVQLSRSSHPRRTPTPAPPGAPPSVVTGTLRRSIVFTEPVPVGQGRWVASIGGTVVYARIHEFGGQTGRNHATTLPARPYLRPTAEALSASGTLTAVAVKAFTAALG